MPNLIDLCIVVDIPPNRLTSRACPPCLVVCPSLLSPAGLGQLQYAAFVSSPYNPYSTSNPSYMHTLLHRLHCTSAVSGDHLNRRKPSEVRKVQAVQKGQKEKAILEAEFDGFAICNLQ
jgi:hypothetical protein